MSEAGPNPPLQDGAWERSAHNAGCVRVCCVGVTAATSSASGALRPGRHMAEGMTRPRRCRQETDNTTHTPSMPTTPDIAGCHHGRLNVLLTHDWAVRGGHHRSGTQHNNGKASASACSWRRSTLAC